MRTGFITLGTATLMTLFLATACAQKDQDTEPDRKNVVFAKADTRQQSELKPSGQRYSVLVEPVNFSTPEEVKNSLQKVLEQAGEKEAQRVSGAMEYLMYYDLSLGRNEQALHKKLDGKTPNQIIALANRAKR